MRYSTLFGSIVVLGWLAQGIACNGTEGSGGTGGTTSGGSSASGGAPSSGGTATGGSAPTGSPGCGNTTLPAACNTTTTGPCTLDVNGTARQFFVVLPSNYNASTPYPLVFTWHGLGGTADSLLPGGYMGGGFYGVKSGFPNAIYVTSQGLDTGSDAGNQYGWPNTNGRDVNFTKAMIAWLEANYCVDTSRLFSTGMSYGGMMSNTLGCQMPDVFRAIGVMSGSLFGRTNSCVKLPIAAWFTHGDADTVVAISGDVTARDMFIANNGCSTTATRTVTMTDSRAKDDAGAPVATVCTIYDQCTAGNYPVVWCPVPGEGHAIPSWAGSEIAKFFLQF